MSTDSTKQFAVVTGGSSGIGLALAKQFALNGFDLLLAAETDGLEQAVLDVRGLGG
ncbi:MAG: SDR family NAD(P)-dependent oxidoreductase, partial [Armatimonadota bacterium]|nr:SDR family NAD(P)-dependent oxidoreductase [Armatimonadota bacterium]